MIGDWLSVFNQPTVFHIRKIRPTFWVCFV